MKYLGHFFATQWRPTADWQLTGVWGFSIKVNDKTQHFGFYRVHQANNGSDRYLLPGRNTLHVRGEFRCMMNGEANGQTEQVKGLLDQAIGKTQDVFGELSGDERTQLEGKARQAAGELQERYGDLLDEWAGFLQRELLPLCSLSRD